MIGRIVRIWSPVMFAIALAACGGKTPGSPTPPPSSGGGLPPPNSPPVIDSITVQGTRAPQEPADFADLGERVQVTAKVHDAETPVDQLEYQWSAPLGTFSGTGASVTWQGPASASTPMDVTITLKVVEHFGFTGQPATFTNEVTGTDTLSLHDSVGEVGGMARQFLLDFSDSNITDVSYVMRNFDPSCQGTIDESGQVATNRQNFNIVRSSIGQASVTIPFGRTFCQIPFPRLQIAAACSTTPSHWESLFTTGPYKGHLQIADGLDYVAANYLSAQKAWKLCDSQFPGMCTDVTSGVACKDEPTRIIGMTPDSWARFLFGRGKQ